jgi:hypothetical protein
MSKNMAVLDENKNVLNIIVCEDDQQENTFLISYTDDNPAYIGGDYLDEYFYPPKPFDSWVRNKGKWEAPTPRPEEGLWYWNEQTLSWIEVENSTV